jgi:iron complex outermembrane receptor protein
MMKNVWLSLSFVGFSSFVFAQVDTVLTVETVEIAAPKLRKNPIGSQSQTYNSQTLSTLPARNIAELLQQETGVFIKTYGSGSLATSSMRGGNAGHTLVLWNNLPIQSPMLGLLDLSLLPTNMVEEVSVQQGGGTAMWGSGAVGGVIALNNQADFANEISGQSQLIFGSFGLFQQNLSAKIGNEKFQSQTKLSHQQADNNFTYRLSPTFERANENATFQQQNILQDFYFKPKSDQTLAAHFWYQTSEREIPPTSVQVRSEAHQNDESFRFVLDYKSIGNQLVTNGKIGFFKEYLNFFDDQIQLVSLSDFSTFLGEFDAQIHLPYRQKILLGTTQTFTNATADGYANQPTEYRVALFAAYNWNFKNWQTQFSIRQEMVNGDFVPITPMFGIEKSFGKWFDLKFKISRNYRLPTLNDRFWQPGGNADLLAENGWSEEATFLYKYAANDWKINVSTTGFNRKIENWIMWSLLQGQSFWSANNIAEVWSRGLEQRLKIDYQKVNWQYHFSAGYNWVRSTNEIAIARPKIPANQQLFYTPEHQFFGKMGANWRKLNVNYYHSFTSATLGVNEDLAAYNLGNLQLGFDWKLGDLKGNLLLNIQNIWNTDYYIVERRPMAGRSFSIVFVIR